MNRIWIWMKPSVFMPEVKMIFEIPVERDIGEYIDEYLEAILDDDMKHNVEWGFE